MMELTIFTCERCGEPSLNKRILCRSCHHDQLTERKIPGDGTVYSFSTIHISSVEFQHEAPYTVAVIELENGLKVTGRLKEKASIGEKVKLIEKRKGIYYFEAIEIVNIP
jgi:uncharacterized protein